MDLVGALDVLALAYGDPGRYAAATVKCQAYAGRYGGFGLAETGRLTHARLRMVNDALAELLREEGEAMRQGGSGRGG